jgi:hypothetical protein
MDECVTMFACICMYACTYVYIHTCTYMYIHIYTYIYTCEFVVCVIYFRACRLYAVTYVCTHEQVQTFQVDAHEFCTTDGARQHTTTHVGIECVTQHLHDALIELDQQLFEARRLLYYVNR